MNYLLKTTLIGLFFGTFGTTIGGIIGVTWKRNSNRFLSFILQLAARAYDGNYMFRFNPRGNRNGRTWKHNYRNISRSCTNAILW